MTFYTDLTGVNRGEATDRGLEADASGSWRNMMSFCRGMVCENVSIKGDKGATVTAYISKQSGLGWFRGVVLVHHAPSPEQANREGGVICRDP